MSFTVLEKSIFNDLLQRIANKLSEEDTFSFPILVTDENREELRQFIDDFCTDKSDGSDFEGLKTSLLAQLELGTLHFDEWQMITYIGERITR